MKANANGTTVRRAADFSETGEYVVTLASGQVERIYRDASQFTTAIWYLVKRREDDGFLGFTRDEAVARLEELSRKAA